MSVIPEEVWARFWGTPMAQPTQNTEAIHVDTLANSRPEVRPKERSRSPPRVTHPAENDAQDEAARREAHRSTRRAYTAANEREGAAQPSVQSESRHRHMDNTRLICLLPLFDGVGTAMYALEEFCNTRPPGTQLVRGWFAELDPLLAACT